MSYWVPELLSPAGNLEKLHVAISYGADAVYLGGQKFGLRSAADNFTQAELCQGVEFAHQNKSLVYVVLNSFLHDQDLKELPFFLGELEEAGVDAVIVSDLGVVETVKRKSNLEVHLSTQASCLNTYAAKLWKKTGVTRVVLGREVSVKEAGRIKRESGLEMEMFVHGSMCMAYSGNCVISNFTQGRDSNRGGCAHSCRFEYSLFSDEKEKRAYFMSSKDLEGIRFLEPFIEEEIDSLKIEGRMKTPHYAATISKVYADALAYYAQHGHFLSDQMLKWEEELGKVSHREYHAGSLGGEGLEDSAFDERESAENEYGVAGMILEAREGSHLLVQVRSPFFPSDELELLSFRGENKIFSARGMRDINGNLVEKSRPGKTIILPFIEGAKTQNIIRIRARK